ncbi:MAG: diguanylate cyclase [Candidatus Omnitrophota bacterium]|jgi:GGDEF domain-containing protein
MEKTKKILIISSDINLKEVLRICFKGWGYEVFLLDTVPDGTDPIKRVSPDVIVVDVYSATKGELEICRLLKDDFLTAFIPVITLINKRQLKTHLLNLKQGVDDFVIKPPDPLDLRVRIEMAVRRSQYSFYASPLTGLPGGRIIEEAAVERLHKNIPFSFGYLDIDKFKSFNDNYGYVKGDRVLMQAAYMLYTIIKKTGTPGDFIGHIGGDDFVFITSPDAYRRICQEFIQTFDRIIPFYYSETDRAQGFILAKDRTNKMKKIPLMSVSIAVVSKVSAAGFASIIAINERIAEIKKYIKNIAGSKFMVDRRSGGQGDCLEPRVYTREDCSSGRYRPLGQILLEKRLLTVEQLDEALCIHWRRGMVFGEVLKELGFIRGEELDAFLATQRRGVP